MPLRELLLLLIVVVLIVKGLADAKTALLGYIWFAIVAPDVLAWCEGKYPISFTLAIVTLISARRHIHRLPVILQSPAVGLLLLLQIPIGLSIIFCEGPFLSMDRYIQFELNTLMILMIPLLLDRAEDLKNFLFVCAISEGLLGSRLGLYGLINGGGALNLGHGRIYDSNELALAIDMMLPICWYTRFLLEKRSLRLLLLATILTAAAAVIMSNSRGGSLALGAVLIYLIVCSGRPVRSFVVAVLAVAPAIYLVQDQYFARMSTIEHYEDEESAAGRVELWGVAIQMWKDHPVLGVGFGNRNFAMLAARYMHRQNFNVAHNTYLQMAADSGIFAFLIFCGLLFGAIWSMGRSAWRLGREESRWRPVPLSIQAALIAYAVGGTFYSHQRYDFAYMLLMAGAAWRLVEQSGELSSTEASGSEQRDAEAVVCPA